MSNLLVRFLTAAIGIPIILGVLYLAPFVAYYLLVGAAMTVAAAEFFGFTHRDDRAGQAFGVVLTVALFALLVATRFAETYPFATLLGCVALPPAALLFGLARPGHIPSALPRATGLVMGPLYVGAGMAALAAIRTFGTSREGAGLVVMTLMIAWLSDTFGYFVGRNVGGPKLYPAVSPNKTWSGSVGGIGGSMVGALLAHFIYLPTLPLAEGVAVAAVAGAFGQAGDLCESVLKRSAGIKDSGGILPGHGGILDRIDALLFVALAVYVALRAGWLALGT